MSKIIILTKVSLSLSNGLVWQNFRAPSRLYVTNKSLFLSQTAWCDRTSGLPVYVNGLLLIIERPMCFEVWLPKMDQVSTACPLMSLSLFVNNDDVIEMRAQDRVKSMAENNSVSSYAKGVLKIANAT